MRKTLQALLEDGFILVFNEDRLDIVRTADALVRAGFRNMEVTCRISRPLEKLQRLRQEMPEFVIGAASLVDSPEMLAIYNRAHPEDPLPSVEEVVEYGADYLVSAVNFRTETYQAYPTKVMIPGCGSANEILTQYAAGANLCKVFPAKQLGGPGFIKAIDPALHKMISLVPTGGTTGENIPDYVDAGVLVVGGSFSMIDKRVFKHIVEDQDYDLLTDELTNIRRLIDESRANKWPDFGWTSLTIESVTELTGRDFNLR